MLTVEDILQIIAIAAWIIGVGSWFYTARFFFPLWRAGFRPRIEHVGYPRKALIGASVFLAAFFVGFGAGFVAQEWFGGWLD